MTSVIGRPAAGVAHAAGCPALEATTVEQT